MTIHSHPNSFPPSISDINNLTVAEYLKQGYNECDAQVKALDEIKKKFNIRFKEVMDNDV